MTTRHPKIDIEAPLREIVTRLGLNYDRVARLDVKPGTVKATVFLERDEGGKQTPYVDDAGNAAMETRIFRVDQ